MFAYAHLAINARAGEAVLQAEPAAVALGEIAGDAKASMKVRIATDAVGVRLTRVMASCGCVTAELPATTTLPAALAAGKDGLELTVTVDPTSYEGAFRKVVYVGYEVDGQDGTEVLEIAVTGTIKADADWEAALAKEGIVPEKVVAPAKALAIRPVEPATTVATMVQHMTIFVSPGCDMCRQLKLEWLPVAVRRGYAGPIYEVDVTTDEG